MFDIVLLLDGWRAWVITSPVTKHIQPYGEQVLPTSSWVKAGMAKTAILGHNKKVSQGKKKVGEWFLFPWRGEHPYLHGLSQARKNSNL